MEPEVYAKGALVLVIGLPGTGKTTFSQQLASAIGGSHLNTDIIRMRTGKRGQYDERSKRLIYRQMLEQTEALLVEGCLVIVDGTFYLKTLRQPFFDLAAKLNVPLHWLLLEADENIIRERTGRKRAYSEADFDVYLKIKSTFEPLQVEHLTLRSDRQEALPKMIRTAAEYIGRPLKKSEVRGYDRTTD